MTKALARQLIDQEALGPDTASQLGKLAHRILDWVVLDGWIGVLTPARGWHAATKRELRILKRG